MIPDTPDKMSVRASSCERTSGAGATLPLRINALLKLAMRNIKVSFRIPLGPK